MQINRRGRGAHREGLAEELPVANVADLQVDVLARHLAPPARTQGGERGCLAARATGREDHEAGVPARWLACLHAQKCMRKSESTQGLGAAGPAAAQSGDGRARRRRARARPPPAQAVAVQLRSYLCGGQKGCPHLRTRSWAEAMGVRVSRPSCRS